MSILRPATKKLIIGGIIGAVLAIGVSFVSPVQYRADGQVYILSLSRYGLDPYTVAKSAEKIGDNLSQVIKTNDFYDKVMANPNYRLDQSYFQGVSERVKRKRWQSTVGGSVVFGTGVLNISAYHKNPDQAVAYAGALIDTLITKGSEYVGDDVSMKVVNQPVVSSLPVRPNFLMNAVVGFAVGFVLRALFVVRRYFKMKKHA